MYVIFFITIVGASTPTGTNAVISFGAGIISRITLANVSREGQLQGS